MDQKTNLNAAPFPSESKNTKFKMQVKSEVAMMPAPLPRPPDATAYVKNLVKKRAEERLRWRGIS